MSHSIIRINNISTDLCQDMWIYISNNIFKLKLNKNEVGSSTMPHKVNPIDFENAEGNFGISNSLNNFFADKLTKSRLQRDLSDSTVLRNIGLSFGYSYLAIFSLHSYWSSLPSFSLQVALHLPVPVPANSTPLLYTLPCSSFLVSASLWPPTSILFPRSFSFPLSPLLL